MGWALGWGLAFNGVRVSVWEDEQVLERDGGDGCTTLMALSRALENGEDGKLCCVYLNTIYWLS